MEYTYFYNFQDLDVCDLETKANVKLMESQSSQGPRPGLDKTEKKSDLSHRISEISREYARNSYTKTDAQKGLGIIIHRNSARYFPYAGDPDTTHLQEFFEEIGFVVKCIKDSDRRQLLKYMTDGKFYCVFIVIMSYGVYEYEYLIRHLLSQKSLGKPVIIMTDSTFDFPDIRENNEDNEILIVMPISQIGRGRGPYGYYEEKNIFDHFMKATRRYRFADIMDILTRMNSLYDYPIITFQSSLGKKFCFL